MIYFNKAMQKALEIQNNEICYEKIDSYIDKIISKIKKIQEAIIYDDEGIDVSAINFDRIFKFVNNWTGYEISCNEIRIDKDIFLYGSYNVFALAFYNALCQLYEDKQFVVYIYLNDTNVDLRFHTYRENEKIWLDENLNIYAEPILCVKPSLN